VTAHKVTTQFGYTQGNLKYTETLAWCIPVLSLTKENGEKIQQLIEQLVVPDVLHSTQLLWVTAARIEGRHNDDIEILHY
jgi:hypothetical protein